jgi:hypothetical protein
LDTIFFLLVQEANFDWRLFWLELELDWLVGRLEDLRILTVWKGNFDSLEKENFDSLKKKNLTVWKREILTV